MVISFIHSFQSEWLKKKRSLASWIVIIGAFFTPLIITIARIVQPGKLQAIYTADNFWESLWRSSWESMAVFLLPLGVILLTSLVTQIEYKNNTWKQLHTLPLRLSTIFFSKLVVIVIMLLQFFILFNIGIYLSGIIPCLLFKDVPFPQYPTSYLYFLKEDLLFFICCLPIIALQYLISLKYKNFLVPVGAGFIFWVGALSALSWKYGYIIPYTYCVFNYLKDAAHTKAVVPAVNIYWLAIIYFVIITIVSYVLYITKREKG